MLRLLLLRHAKSAWPVGVEDRDRPLAPRGRRAAPAIGAYMAREGLAPSRVLVSPARRTLETWAHALDAWQNEPPSAYEEAIYEAPAERLLTVIRRQGAVSPLMLVGHNPGMEDLAAQLLAPAERARMPGKYPTGGLAVIDIDAAGWGDIQPDTGRLDRFIAPRTLGLSED